MKFLGSMLLVAALAACCPAMGQTGANKTDAPLAVVPTMALPPLAISPVDAGPDSAAPAASTAITPAEAQDALDILQDDAKRQQLIETLRTISAASRASSPGPAASPTPGETAKPAEAPK
jgi:hypothetical protein